MKMNVQIRTQRKALGLSEKSVAEYAGLSIHEYADLESYDDELYTVVPIDKLIKLCAKLNLDLAILLGFEKSRDLLRRDSIGSRMQELDISVQQLSDVIGISETFIKNAMSDIGSLSGWVVEPVIDLAKELDLNPGAVLDSISGKPGSEHNSF